MIEIAQSWGVPDVVFTMHRNALVAACLLVSQVPLLTAVELVYERQQTPESIKGWSCALAVEVLKNSAKRRRQTGSAASGTSDTSHA